MNHVVLEVERKFAGFAVPRLALNAGTPGFLDLRYLGEHNFTDRYYDEGNKWSSNGIWLRKRQLAGKVPIWEAKHRKGGTFNNSMFEEITNLERIAGLVKDITGRDDNHRNDFGLKKVAKLATDRKSWCADNQFKIVLDSTDFGHEVGEVELEQTFTVPIEQAHACGVTEWKRRITQGMDLQIHNFMTRYSWALRKNRKAN